MTARVGLLVGRERSFPDALIEEINRRGQGVSAEYAKIDATRHDVPPPYEVIVDRISHDVTCYQPVLKLAAMSGTRVINDPFWRMADDKFFNAAVAARLGVKVPKTYVLPSRSYNEDVSNESLSNLVYPLDWNRIVGELRFPLYIKPHWGGGWRDVSRIESIDQLMAAFDRSGQRTMMLQEEISWTQYVRCIVVGQEHVLPALWDPRRWHFDRYVRAAEAMPPLSSGLANQLMDLSRKLCRALGYQMNTVEWAIRDGVPYAIDFMNSAPDFDVSSLGEGYFGWVVEKMADLCVGLAKDPASGSGKPRWRETIDG